MAAAEYKGKNQDRDATKGPAKNKRDKAKRKQPPKATGPKTGLNRPIGPAAGPMGPAAPLFGGPMGPPPGPLPGY